MDTKDVEISIIVPVFNTEPYFDRCISSILNQSFQNIEIVVVNDCSQGDIDSLITQYNKDNRVIYKSSTEHLSLGGARNLGLSVAKGKYVFFCDSDDWLDLMTLEVLYNKIIETNADIAICSLFKDYGDQQGRFLSSYDHEYSMNGATALHILSNQYDFGIGISPSPANKLYDKKFLDHCHLKFEPNKYYEESAFIFKALTQASKIIFVKKGKYHYFNRTGSILQTISEKHIEDFYDVFKGLKQFLETTSLFGNFKHDYYSYLERYFTIVVDQIYAHTEDIHHKKYLLKQLLTKINKLITLDEFLEYTQIDKLRLHFHPIQKNQSPI